MRASDREDGVLKLVYPGRQVEIHRKPVSASEVMKKHPRHYVARPDVFKYPWVVISPESLLFPGEVFYVVPKTTIYSLLKAKGYNNRKPNPEQNPSPKYHHHQHQQKNLSFRDGSGQPLSHKHQKNSHNLKRPFQQCMPWEGMSSFHDQETAERRNTYEEYKHHQNRRNIRQSRTSEYFCGMSAYDDDTDNETVHRNRLAKRKEILGYTSSRSDDADKKIVCYKPVEVLKPVLRKQDIVHHKCESRRVKFASPLLQTG